MQPRVSSKIGNPEDEYFLVTFSQRSELTEGFTSDILRLQNHMIFTPAKGFTPLLDAVYLGLETLKTAKHKRKALVLITDGEDNHSRYSFSDIKEFVKEQDVQIFAIGIVNPRRACALPKREGDYRRINPDQWRAGFFPGFRERVGRHLLQDRSRIKNQYVLGYHSTNEARDGKWRKIRLKITPPKGASNLSVRGKSGYYAESLNIKP
jgi:Ca-activated chloride channel homolog